MGVRSCHSTNAHTPPQTVTINTTEFLHSNTKSSGTRKVAYPDSISTLNSCLKTCVKNQGTVQFNPDGTVVKAAKPPKGNGNGEKNHKNGKEYTLCATHLGCQLAAVDKKLEKQAKHLCKLQSGPQDDYDSNLCTCLETALGQNLHCADQLSNSESCSSPSGSCSQGRQTGSKH